MEAVDAFKAAVEAGQKYDLICMDIMLPVVDGHTAVRLIRDEEATGELPTGRVKIIMTTALSAIEDVSRAYYSECDAYMVKPIDLSKLAVEIGSLGLIQVDPSEEALTDSLTQ
jgi:two-component system chemotaxis response regulator CheY